MFDLQKFAITPESSEFNNPTTATIKIPFPANASGNVTDGNTGGEVTGTTNLSLKGINPAIVKPLSYFYGVQVETTEDPETIEDTSTGIIKAIGILYNILNENSSFNSFTTIRDMTRSITQSVNVGE